MTQINSALSTMTETQTNTDVFLELAASVGQKVPAERLYIFKTKERPNGNPRFWGIVDFNQHSSKKRFYVFDTKEKTVQQYLVAHGKGSDANHDGMADKFSNEGESKSSSLGIYRCAETYSGKHGFSLRMDGLEEINSNVRRRDIVLHKANYVSQDFINKNNGILGRSDGCFAVENAVHETLINQLKDGSYIIAWKK